MRLLARILGALLVGTFPLSQLAAQAVPAIALTVPKVEGGYVTPASPVLFATASPGTTVPPSTIVRVDFLDGGTVIGSLTAPNSIPTGYAFVWQNAPPGMHLVAARCSRTMSGIEVSPDREFDARSHSRTAIPTYGYSYGSRVK